jgi:hypothetical protein
MMNAPIEPKVKAATIGSYLLGVLGVALLGGFTDGNLIALLPDWASAILTPLLPTLGAAIAGYAARHQYRDEPSGSQFQ